MQSKLFGLVSLSKKAGKLVVGFDAVKEAVYSGQAYMVILASDLSPKTAIAMDRVLENMGNNPPYKLVSDLTMYDYSQICRKLVGVLAITDQGFADGIRKLPPNSETDKK